jgi:predicted enzyme related to lactoylglutathione lyase
LEGAVARFVIDYFELPTTAAGSSAAFFSKAFGFGSKSYGPDYIEVTEGGVLGGLNGDSEGRSASPVIGIRTDDIAAAQQAVEAAGGAVTIPVMDYPGGQRFFFREPGGSELLVYCPGE